MGYSLYNPFMAWKMEQRTFGDPEPSPSPSSDPSPSPSPSPSPAPAPAPARSETEVQADINAALEASGGDWTPELNDLVSERTAVRESPSPAPAPAPSPTPAPSPSPTPSPSPSPTPAPAPATIGSVSSTGQYAGDGFEWVENEGGYLTRTYTGANADAGLGTDVIAGGTADKDTKEAIAQLSLDEGTPFANSAGSATDGDLLNLFKDGTFGASDSYADQIGAATPATQKTDYSTESSFDDAFAEARNNLGAGQTFTYNGSSYSTAVAGEDSALDAAIASSSEPGGTTSVPDVEVGLSPEEQLMEQSVTTPGSQDYLDSLGEFDSSVFTEPVSTTGGYDEIPANLLDSSGSGASVSQDLLDQIGGAPGTTIESLLPGNATGDTDLADMNFQERFDRQSELADADPTGQSTATGTLLSDGSTVDTLVSDTDDGLKTFEATRVAGSDDPASIQEVSYTDSRGNSFSTLAEAQLSDSQDLNRQLAALNTAPQEISYVNPMGGPERLINAQVVDGPIGSLDPNANSSYSGSTTSSGSGGMSYADMLRSSGVSDAEISGMQDTIRTTPVDTRDPLNAFPTGSDMGSDTFGNFLPGGAADTLKIIGSGLESIGNRFAGQDIAQVGYGEGQVDPALARAVGVTPGQESFAYGDEAALTTFGRDMKDAGQLLSDRVTGNLSESYRENLEAPIFGDDGFNLDALTSKVTRGVVPVATAASGLLFGAPGALATGAVMTTGDVADSTDKLVQQAYDNGELGPISESELQTVKNDVRNTGFVPSMVGGAALNLIPLAKGPIAQRFLANAAGEAFEEGIYEPNVANIATDVTTGTNYGLTADPDAALTAAVLGGPVSLAGTSTTTNAASNNEAGPNVQAESPGNPFAGGPASDVISGTSLSSSTTSDPVVNTAPPSVLSRTQTSTAPNIITIPGTNVEVQAIAPAQNTAPSGPQNSGLGSLGTGGTFVQPNQGSVPALPAPSDTDSAPNVDASPPGLTASEILQNEVDIITTDTNTSVEDAKAGAASLSLIETAQAAGANVQNGDSRAKVEQELGIITESQPEAGTGSLDAAEASSQTTLPEVDVGLINQTPQVDLPAGVGSLDAAAASSQPDPTSQTDLSNVDVSNINASPDLPLGVGSLDAAVAGSRQNLTPEGIISLEVAETGALSNETAQKLATENNLSMQDVANMAENAMGLETSQATGPKTDVDVAATVEVVDPSTGGTAMAAGQQGAKTATEGFVFDGEVIDPVSDVSVDVQEEVDPSTIEGTLGSRDVQVSEPSTTVETSIPVETNVPVDTSVTTTTNVPVDTFPPDAEEEDEVVVEVDEPVVSDPSGPGDDDDDDVVVDIDTGDSDDDDDDEVVDEAPFTCPDGYEAVKINDEWRCQATDAAPARMRPTGGSYYQPRKPSPASKAKAYRFR